MTNEMDDQGENENWEIRFRQDEELDFFTELALHETERWIQSVTRKKFAYPDDLRRSLENGVLLCELLNNLKPGSIKRINKLPGPIAGLDNINVFLKACKSSFGLNDTHLFDVTDLEDLSQRAISESEDILKLEQDRRSRNVAVTIYWLGRAVSGYYSGTKLDFSAFAALVNHHGKDLISTDNFHHDSWESTEQSSAYSSHESNSRGSLHDSLDKKHNRDSSYDSYGSCSNSRESELSFSLEEENMPGISMRRYGSTSSINRSGELQLPLNSEDDSLYQSTPDLANSNNHARSPSTDSMDGSYHGNHSRQSSDSVEIPTRTLSSQRKVSQSSVDPMQFVKIKSSDYMAKKAEHQIKLSQEVKKVRTTIDREEEDWQSNLSSWKTRRRKQSAATIERVEETDKLTKEKEEEEEEIKPKTYTQILAERTERRKSTGRLNFYPVEDDEDSLFSSPSPVKEDIVSSVVSRPVESTNRAPALSMKQRSSSTSESYVTYNDTAKASWAESSSDEETNQSEPKIEKMSTRLQQIEKTYTNKFSDSVKETRSTTNDSSYSRDKVSNRESPPIQKKLKTWKSENSLMNEKKMAPWKNDHKESNFGSSGNKINTGQSPGKVSNILKNFKEKEEKAKDYHNPRRSYDFKTDINSSARPSRLKNTKWNTFDTPSGSLTFSAPEKAASVLSPRSTITEKTKPVPTKAAVEKTIKISQKPNNTKGFGFTISGGADKRQPIVVQKISLGQGDTTLDGKSSAADVCEVLQNDEILTINDRDVSWLSHAQVQKLIDDAVKIGHIDLKVRRAISSDEDFEEEDDVHVTNSPKSKPEHLPTALTPRQSRGHSPANHQSTTPQRSPSESKAYTPAEGRYRSGSPMNYSPAERSYRVRSPAEGQYTPPTSRRSREASPIITRSQSPLQRSTKSPSTFNEHRQTPSKDYKAMKDTQLHTDDHLNEDIVESNNNDLKNDLIGEPSPVEDSEPPFQQVTSPPQHVELEVSRQVVTPVKQEPKPVQEELIPKVEAPVKQEVLPQTETPKHEVEITEKPVIAFRRERKTPAIESPITVQTKPKEMHEESPDKWDLPPPPPTEAPPDVPDADNEDSGVGPPAFLRRWQQKKSRPKSEYLSSSNDNKKDPEKRLSASFLLDFNRHSDDEKLPVVEPVIVQEKKKENNTEPLLMTTKATVGQPVTLEIADESEPQKNPERSQPVMVTPAFQAGQLQIDPRNLMDSSEENLPQYNFHVNINKVNLQSEPKSVVVDTTAIEREREKIREEEQKRVEEERRRWEEEEQKKLEEKAAALRKQEQKIREEEEKLRQEKERMQREREELEKSRKLQKEPEPKSFQVRQNSPTTHFSASTSHIDNNRPAPSLRKLDVSKPMMESLGTKDKTRWSRQDMLAMNRKATPLQKKPEHEETENSVSSEVSREAPSKQDLHNLNAVPKSKFRGSMDWMKPEDKELHSSIHNSAAKPVLRTEGNRGSSNFHEHWLIEEAERRRKAGSPNRHSATLPLNSSLQIKPSNSVMNRWRDDSSVPKQQTSISLQGNLSQPRTLSTTVSHNRNHDKNLASKHSYTPIQQTKVSLSQTLPHNFNSSLSPKRDQPSVLPKPMRNSSSPSASSPTSPVNQAEQFMAVSGKQCCSYCHEELGFGAAMVIESLGLYYHVQCFRCCVCHTALGNGSQGTDVRVRVNKLHCRNCYSNDEGSRRRERRSHNN